MWALARVRPGYAVVPCCTQKDPEPAAAPSPMSDLTGKRLVRQPRLAMIYGGWWPRHPIDTALSNSCSLAVPQDLRLALPRLGSAHTYFEHFDIFIGTVGKDDLCFSPLPALLWWRASEKKGRRFQILSMLALFAGARQSPL